MRRRGFTLIEVMIVVLIIGILTSIAAPQFLNARARSQQRTCMANLRQIAHAKDIWATQNNIPNGAPCNQGNLWPEFIRGASFPACPANGLYVIGDSGITPTCSEQGGPYSHEINY